MKDKKVFLDINFLVASQIKNHTFFARTQRLRENFISEEADLYVNPLVLDEFWYVLTGIWKAKYKNGKSKQLNQALQDATKNILAFRNIQLANPVFDDQDLMNTLECMKAYKLKPRDALITMIMKKEKITRIASFDDDFASVKGIKVVN